jgi:hypothetical protein
MLRPEDREKIEQRKGREDRYASLCLCVSLSLLTRADHTARADGGARPPWQP